MSTYAAPIEVKKAACIEAGIEPILNETGAGRRQVVLNTRYEPLVRRWLAIHAWKFATTWTPVVYGGENTSGVHRYSYQIPTDPNGREILRYRGFYWANPAASLSDFTRADPLPFDLTDGALQSNVNAPNDEVVALYTMRATEAAWGPLFAEAVVKILAAPLIKAIRKDSVSAEKQMNEGMAEMARASAIEAEQFERASPSDNQLIHAWHNGAC